LGDQDHYIAWLEEIEQPEPEPVRISKDWIFEILEETNNFAKQLILNHFERHEQPEQANYMQVVDQSDEEKLAMYMKSRKEELAKMLIQCNKIIYGFGITSPFTSDGNKKPKQEFHNQFKVKEIDWEKLRTDYFNTCTHDQLGRCKINFAPHDLFEWFKSRIEGGK
jgi:hypothetical protein